MYTKADLTAIIPTLGRDLPLLAAVAGRIDAEGLALRIVWDGRTVLSDDIRTRLLGMARRVEVVAHTHNRGLSAARNTGARGLESTLGMFIDDDIIPCEGFAEEVIRFHNQHPDPDTMLMGCVSWRTTPYASPLTEWFETQGNWSVFHTATAGQPLSNFMGGFTSFKASALADIGFDEGFTRYGCEDVEFGYRFFRRGGCLIYWPKVHGAHHKPLDLATYCRDHRGAGHSRGILLGLHPDIAFDFNLIARAILHRLPDAQIAELMHSAEHVLQPRHAPHCTQEIHALMQTLTDQAILAGLAECLCLSWPGFAALPGEPDRDTLIHAVDDFAPFLLLHARQSSDPAERDALLQRASALMPHYAAPHLQRLAWNPEDACARQALRDYLAHRRPALDLRTERSILQALGERIEQSARLETLSARDLFFRMEDAARQDDTAAVARLAEIILDKDASYVGAYIAWAKTLPAHTAMRRLLLRLADHFVNSRPAHEQVQRRAEIQALAAHTAETHPEPSRS
jgi:hypothetical protein